MALQAIPNNGSRRYAFISPALISVWGTGKPPWMSWLRCKKEDVTGIYTLRGKAEALQHLGRHGEADDRLKLIPEGRQ